MGKWSEISMTNQKNAEKLEKWYEKMDREFKQDAKEHDFSLSRKWDRDFKHSIFYEANKTKRRKLLYTAASVVLLILLGVGVAKKEAIAEELEKIFKYRTKDLDCTFDNYSTSEEIIVANRKTEKVFYCHNETLDAVYVQIKSLLKRPIFQISNDLGEYQVEDAVYDECFRIITLKLQTEEGKIFVSQKEILDDGGTSIKIDDDSIVVWNENLKQNIIINQSNQDGSYIFSAQKGFTVFNFYGYVSMQQCAEIAKNLLFK